MDNMSEADTAREASVAVFEDVDQLTVPVESVARSLAVLHHLDDTARADVEWVVKGLLVQAEMGMGIARDASFALWLRDAVQAALVSYRARTASPAACGGAR